MKTIAPEIATPTVIHAPAERNPRIPRSRGIYKLQEASRSTAERFHHYRPSVPTTGTPSERTGSEGGDYEEIISAQSSSRVRSSVNFYNGHYMTERRHFHFMKKATSEEETVHKNKRASAILRTTRLHPSDD